MTKKFTVTFIAILSAVLVFSAAFIAFFLPVEGVALPLSADLGGDLTDPPTLGTYVDLSVEYRNSDGTVLTESSSGFRADIAVKDCTFVMEKVLLYSGYSENGNQYTLSAAEVNGQSMPLEVFLDFLINESLTIKFIYEISDPVIERVSLTFFLSMVDEFGVRQIDGNIFYEVDEIIGDKTELQQLIDRFAFYKIEGVTYHLDFWQDKTTGQVIEIDSYIMREDLEIIAIYKPVTVQVSFQYATEKGIQNTSLTLDYGAKISADQLPQVEDFEKDEHLYSFLHWSQKNEGDPIDFSSFEITKWGVFYAVYAVEELTQWAEVYIHNLHNRGGMLLDTQEYRAELGQIWIDHPFDEILSNPEYTTYKGLDIRYKLSGFALEENGVIIDHKNYLIDREIVHFYAVYELSEVDVTITYMVTGGYPSGETWTANVGECVKDQNWLMDYYERYNFYYDKDNNYYELIGFSFFGDDYLIEDFLNYRFTEPVHLVFVYEIKMLTVRFFYQTADDPDAVYTQSIAEGWFLDLTEFPYPKNFIRGEKLYTFSHWSKTPDGDPANINLPIEADADFYGVYNVEDAVKWSAIRILGLRFDGKEIATREFKVEIGKVWADHPFHTYLNDPDFSAYAENGNFYELKGFALEPGGKLVDYTSLLIDRDKIDFYAIYEVVRVEIEMEYRTQDGELKYTYFDIDVGTKVEDCPELTEALCIYSQYGENGKRYVLAGAWIEDQMKLLEEIMVFEINEPVTFVLIYQEMQKINIRFFYMTETNLETEETRTIYIDETLEDIPVAYSFKRDGFFYDFLGWACADEDDLKHPEDLCALSFDEDAEFIAIYDINKLTDPNPGPDPTPTPGPDPSLDLPLKWYEKVGNWFKDIGAPFVSAGETISSAWQKVGAMEFSGYAIGKFFQILIAVIALPSLVAVVWIAYKIVRAIFRLIKIIFRFIARLFRR